MLRAFWGGVDLSAKYAISPGPAPEIALVYAAKSLFAHLMNLLPWTTFTRIVSRHQGDRYAKSLSCAQHFRVMAFAQLAYRESLRDIEVCLAAQSNKLSHMGFRQPIKRATLFDVNAKRDWRIYADFAQRVILRNSRPE